MVPQSDRPPAYTLPSPIPPPGSTSVGHCCHPSPTLAGRESGHQRSLCKWVGGLPVSAISPTDSPWQATSCFPAAASAQTPPKGQSARSQFAKDHTVTHEPL